MLDHLDRRWEERDGLIGGARRMSTEDLPLRLPGLLLSALLSGRGGPAAVIGVSHSRREAFNAVRVELNSELKTRGTGSVARNVEIREEPGNTPELGQDDVDRLCREADLVVVIGPS